VVCSSPALDLLGRGVRVSIVADAVCSRRAASMDLGLAQARQAGAVITSTETVVFQLLGSSRTEAFREITSSCGNRGGGAARVIEERHG